MEYLYRHVGVLSILFDQKKKDKGKDKGKGAAAGDCIYTDNPRLSPIGTSVLSILCDQKTKRKAQRQRCRCRRFHIY